MNQIEIYKSADNKIELQVNLEKDTVWLTQKQITVLFERDRTVITRHINNVFNEGELDKNQYVQILHILPQEVELTQESIVRKMHSVNNTFRNGTNWQGIPDNSNDSGNE